ncbi:hypothetical protein HNQ37_000739 [Lactovum miscens]|uniref:Uncharacterized protein n=1 Tax=Lactovum miscens TaxID=190387 RepID=A0A841C9I9_9LACT|nr:hypothetical protein [Lactovum miscens]
MITSLKNNREVFRTKIYRVNLPTNIYGPSKKY